MARIRTIKPEFWSDGDLAELPRDTRLFYIALWNFVDDNGVIEYKPKTIKALTFPHDHDLSIEIMINQLISCDKLTKYNYEKQIYICCNKLNKHQKIDRPRKSMLPKPESGEIIRNHKKSDEISLVREGKGRYSRVREGKVREGIKNNAACQKTGKLIALKPPLISNETQKTHNQPQNTKTSKSGHPCKPESISKANWQPMIDHIFKIWEKKKGVKLNLTGQQAKAFQLLHSNYGPEAVMAFWDMWFESGHNWSDWAWRTGRSIETFVKSIPSMLDANWKERKKKYEIMLNTSANQAMKDLTNLVKKGME